MNQSLSLPVTIRLIPLLCITLWLLIPANTSAEDKPKPLEIKPSLTVEKIGIFGAEFVSHTGSDKKDEQTGVYIYVTTKDEKTILAQIENADGAGPKPKEYLPKRDHVIKLTIVNHAITKSECAGFKVKVKSKASGNDNWEFKGRVTLYFKDGTNISSSKDGLSLNSTNSQLAEVNF
ncbi:MAG: hypothetical protein JWQ71_4077 [Pedosphaera sp.]|nr:hypothetical protein [Pedosphaera sp.]